MYSNYVKNIFPMYSPLFPNEALLPLQTHSPAGVCTVFGERSFNFKHFQSLRTQSHDDVLTLDGQFCCKHAQWMHSTEPSNQSAFLNISAPSTILFEISLHGDTHRIALWPAIYLGPVILSRDLFTWRGTSLSSFNRGWGILAALKNVSSGPNWLCYWSKH